MLLLVVYIYKNNTIIIGLLCNYIIVLKLLGLGLGLIYYLIILLLNNSNIPIFFYYYIVASLNILSLP